MPVSEMTGRSSANMPRDADGRMYHIGLREGEVHPRILTVGDHARAARLASMLDEGWTKRVSSRGYTTINGRFEGTDVSIIAIGMGMAMTDFLIREARALFDTPIIVLRLGTCGSITGQPIGSLTVATSAVCVTRNYEHFHGASDQPAYHISSEVFADEKLTGMMEVEAKKEFEKVIVGCNATADTFYASQGRTTPFRDDNEDLIKRLKATKTTNPMVSFEMETFKILHLAHCAHPIAGQKAIIAGGAHIVAADREGDQFVNHEEMPKLEMKGGRAMLRALIQYPLSA